MISKKIVYTRNDGQLIVVYISESARNAGETDDAFALRIRNKDVPSDATNVNIVDINLSLPPRALRDSWQWNSGNGSVEIGLVKARQTILKQVRDTRNALLDDTDKIKAKLDDIGSPTDKIALATYRQQLRDFPTVVQTEISGLNRAQLLAYTPTYPTNPNL